MGVVAICNFENEGSQLTQKEKEIILPHASLQGQGQITSGFSSRRCVFLNKALTTPKQSVRPISE